MPAYRYPAVNDVYLEGLTLEDLAKGKHMDRRRDSCRAVGAIYIERARQVYLAGRRNKPEPVDD